MVITVASQQEGPGFDPGVWAFSVGSLHVSSVSAWVLSRSSGFDSPKTCKRGIRLIGHSKLPVGVKVSLGGSLSLCQLCNEMGI